MVAGHAGYLAIKAHVFAKKQEFAQFDPRFQYRIGFTCNGWNFRCTRQSAKRLNGIALEFGGCYQSANFLVSCLFCGWTAVAAATTTQTPGQ